MLQVQWDSQKFGRKRRYSYKAKNIKLLMKSRSIQRGKKSKGIHINSEVEFESEINTHNLNNISNIIK